MTNKLLLPNKYKLIGWCLLIPATIFGIILSFTQFTEFHFNAKVFAIFNDVFMGERQLFSIIDTNITNTVTGVLFIIGAMFVGFSKEKKKMNLLQISGCRLCFGLYGSIIFYCFWLSSLFIM